MAFFFRIFRTGFCVFFLWVSIVVSAGDKIKVRLATVADKVRPLEIFNVGQFTATHQMAVAMQVNANLQSTEKEMLQESLTYKTQDALEEKLDAYLERTFSNHPEHIETFKRLFAERAQMSWEEKVNLSSYWDHTQVEGSEKSSEYDQFVKGPYLVLRMQEGKDSEDSVEGIEWQKIPFAEMLKASIVEALQMQNAIEPSRSPATSDTTSH